MDTPFIDGLGTYLNDRTAWNEGSGSKIEKKSKDFKALGILILGLTEQISSLFSKFRGLKLVALGPFAYHLLKRAAKSKGTMMMPALLSYGVSLWCLCNP